MTTLLDLVRGATFDDFLLAPQLGVALQLDELGDVDNGVQQRRAGPHRLFGQAYRFGHAEGMHGRAEEFPAALHQQGVRGPSRASHGQAALSVLRRRGRVRLLRPSMRASVRRALRQVHRPRVSTSFLSLWASGSMRLKWR